MEQDKERWDQWLAQTAARTRYPQTPDMAGGVRRRLTGPAWEKRMPFSSARLAWTMVVLLLFAALLLVPDVRAGVRALLRAGAITILVDDEVPSAALESARPLLDNAVPSTLPEIRTIFAETGLADRFPEPLGEPDLAYVDSRDRPQVGVLVWLASPQSAEVAYSLYLIDGQEFGVKQAEVVQMTTVNGADGFWIEGPHNINLQDGSTRSWQLVEGNVLIWWGSRTTYRLEGAATVQEAVALAEALIR